MAAIFTFIENEVRADISRTRAQHTRGLEQEQALRQAVQPLIDGLWIGTSANAFFEAHQAFLANANIIDEQIDYLRQSLEFVVDHTEQMIAKVNTITNS